MAEPKTKLRQLQEQLARVIHERYVETQMGVKGPDDPAMQSWERLREDLKESNRQQAAQIPEKLRAVGYALALVAGRPQKWGFTGAELEELSHMEHRRWMDEKLKGGWKYGAEKDAVKKTDPCLVAWEDLPEEEKEKDRQAVRQIPELLAQAGFEIYKPE